MDPSRPAGSSTSPRRPSRSSRPSGAASSTSASAGDEAEGTPVGSTRGLGVRAIRELAARHGIRPTRSLGQHFLIDPNLARAIAADAEVGPGDHVVEIGAGLGSLTVALAATGARVLAVEFDRRLIPALQESIADLAEVRVLQDDAMKIDWSRELGRRRWVVCANLPYNVAVPLVLDMLDQAPSVRRFVVMVQREVGERLAAAAGTESYGAVSVRVAYRATAVLIRRVPAAVFWPRPAVESVVVRLDRHSRPPVDVDPARLWPVVDAGFGERRKTMRSALRRLGLEPQESVAVLDRAGIERNARAESLTLDELAAIAGEMPP